MSSIHSLGYDEFFDTHFRLFCDSFERPRATLNPARVIRQDRDAWITSDGARSWTARLTGQLRHAIDGNEQYPSIGDWVVLETNGDAEAARLCALLPRRSALMRQAAGSRTTPQPIAANVDSVLIVMGLDNDFNPRRLERYVAAVEGSGATPAIVLNKADLVDDVERFTSRMRVPRAIPILPVSAVTGSGIDALWRLLAPRTTSVLVGSSGVGKSTLVNLLLGHEQQPTQPVRAGDERGQHTTTRREILALSNGALLIDTPGMRELKLWADEDGLGAAFADIRDLAAECRFRDCQHHGEPGCAVAIAIDHGEIDADRLRNYDKQLREIQRLARRRGEQAQRGGDASAQKKRIARFNRERKKHGVKW